MDQARSSRTGTLPIFSIYFKVKVLTSSGTTLPHHMGKGLLMVSGERTVKRMVWNAVYPQERWKQSKMLALLQVLQIK